MTTIQNVELQQHVVRERAFVRASTEGLIDGERERGIYTDDVRIVRRAEVWRALTADSVPAQVELGDDCVAIRFDAHGMEPGHAVLCSVELDGTDIYAIREMLLDVDAHVSQLPHLGAARAEARALLDVSCDGATLEWIDGVAYSDAPAAVDGTSRTASWRWRVDSSAPGPVDVRVELRISWSTQSDVRPATPLTYAQIEQQRHSNERAWREQLPTISAGDASVRSVVARCLDELDMLRLTTPEGVMFAAGVPWYLTVFGRDSLLSAWMALPVDPAIAEATLRHLAATQSQSYDLELDAERGKIAHEERRGIAAQRWHERYYGSVDSTPLFVMLLAEHAAWTGNDALLEELEQPARLALDWIVARVEEDTFGLLGYWRRSDRGLDVQSWKDSSDSQRDRLGRVATGAIRPLEAQAFAIAALRAGGRMAERVWEDLAEAERWRSRADELEFRFLDRFVVTLADEALGGEHDPRRGGYLALAVDADGVAVDSLTSNIGQVLWSGAVADEWIVSGAVRQLTDPALASGWGIRTMSTLDAGFDPFSYHCGSVWPHDTALAVSGLAHHDVAAAARIARSVFDAGAAADGRLPELFGGLARTSDVEAPDVIASTCSPQAWASAAPLLLLRAVLGLEVDNGSLVARETVPASWLRGLEWRGIRAVQTTWDVVVDGNGVISVTRA